MVILSAAILGKGKTLVARQFCEMSRIRVEGLLSAFLKLVEGGKNKDHTYIETETVRYVYQPVESLFILLITNKSSNILEDLEALRLISKVVQDVCQATLTEELVLKNAFDLVFALDECVTFGYRESVTVSQIKTYMEMDSHEERLHDMIEQSKINEAKEIAKKKQKALLQSRIQEKLASAKEEAMGTTVDSLKKQLDALQSSQAAQPAETPAWAAALDKEEAPAPVALMPKKGLSLGKKPQATSEMLSEVLGKPKKTELAAMAEPTSPAAPVNPLLEPVNVAIEETVKATLMSEGGLKGEVDIQGQFVVTVVDTAKAELVAFKLNSVDPKYKFKVHPNLNKASHANNILEVKDPARGYRANVDAPLLKWRFGAADEDLAPLSLSCWPSPTADGISLVIEFELSNDSVSLKDVKFKIPVPSAASPEVISVSSGECGYDGNNECIVWSLEQVNSGDNSGTLELSASCDESSIFPLSVEAAREDTHLDLQILESFHMTSKDPIKFALRRGANYLFTVER